MAFHVLVVDDEKLAQEVLMHHISKFEILQLEGVCNNVFELITFLNKDKSHLKSKPLNLIRKYKIRKLLKYYK